MKKICWFAFVSIIFSQINFIHASDSFQLSGYAKSLNFVSPSDNYKTLSGNRLRLDAEWQGPNQNVDFKLISDNELLTGSLLASQKNALNAQLPKNELINLRWTLDEKEDLIWRHLFYRAYAKAKFKNLDAIAGRQRIAWGQGRIWNPTDVINPYNPLSVEREERPGSDALDLKWNFDSLSFVEAAYVPARKWDWDQTLLLGKLHWNFAQMDWELTGGKRDEERIAGFGHAAQIFDGSLRSEMSYNFNSSMRRDFLRAVLSYDYSFSFAHPLYLLGEFYYNGIGERNSKNYIQVKLKPNDQQFTGKDYWGSGLTYEFSALWKGECYAIANLDDGSAFAAPKIIWQPFTDFELAAGYQAFIGAERSEFGPVKDIAFLQLQWFFKIK